jgi:acyl-coenzyme A synthetase/AMP-(fatty) acid ligase
LNAHTSFPLCNRKAHDIIAFQNGLEIQTQQLISQAKAIATNLPKHAYVFNLCTDRYKYLLGFCAALLAGQCTLMPPNRLPKTLQRLSQDYPDNYSLTDSDTLFSVTARQNADSEVDFQVPNIPIKQLCAVAFTSGSTGTPTPNLKYWDTLRNSTFGNIDLLLPDLKSQLNLLATVPPQHMWGMETSILLPLFANVAVSDQTPFYPQDIADALQALPAPRALVSSPVHLNVLLKSKVPLTELQYIFSATAPMSQELAQQLESQFATKVVEIFGSSESGIVARRQTSTETSWLLSDLFKLQISDDGVEVRADHLPEKVFIKDVIEMMDDRHFKWLGRHQDMLNIAGKRGSLADLNRRLLTIEGVQDGIMFLPADQSERVAAMVVAPSMQARQIMDLLKDEIESVFLPRPLLLVDSLPRQATGKLANRDILKKFASLTTQQRKGTDGTPPLKV